MRDTVLRITLADCVQWARVVVRECQARDLNLVVITAAELMLVDVRELANGPAMTLRAWTRCGEPTLRGWRDQARRMGNEERARAYEAIIAVRLLAADCDP